MTIPQTLVADRGERELYIGKARLALRNCNAIFYGKEAVHILRKDGNVRSYLWPDAYLFHLDACECFIRRARLANHRIVRLKRAARLIVQPPGWGRAPF